MKSHDKHVESGGELRTGGEDFPSIDPLRPSVAVKEGRIIG